MVMYCARCGISGKKRFAFLSPKGWVRWSKGGIDFFLCQKCDHEYTNEVVFKTGGRADPCRG